MKSGTDADEATSWDTHDGVNDVPEAEEAVLAGSGPSGE